VGNSPRRSNHLGHPNGIGAGMSSVTLSCRIGIGVWGTAEELRPLVPGTTGSRFGAEERTGLDGGGTAVGGVTTTGDFGDGGC